MSGDLVDLRELHFPPAVVQEGTHIESVVIETVALLMQRWRQSSNLVAVQRIEVEELLHFVGHLVGVHLSFVRPVQQQIGVHRERTHAINLSQRCEEVKLFIG